MEKKFSLLLSLGFINLLAPACADDQGYAGGPGRDPGVGMIELAVQAGSSITFATASYVITGPAAYMVSGAFSSGAQANLSILIGGIPAANGYTISLSGTTSDMTTCMGSVLFDVVAQVTTAVTVHLVCHEPPRGSGGVSLHSTTNICPVIDGATASPTSLPVGGSVVLVASAHDADSSPSPLQYHWTTTSGTFDNALAQNPTFTCTAVGTAQLMLTLSDGDTAAGCADQMVLSVSCTSM